MMTYRPCNMALAGSMPVPKLGSKLPHWMQ